MTKRQITELKKMGLFERVIQLMSEDPEFRGECREYLIKVMMDRRFFSLFYFEGTKEGNFFWGCINDKLEKYG